MLKLNENKYFHRNLFSRKVIFFLVLAVLCLYFGACSTSMSIEEKNAFRKEVMLRFAPYLNSTQISHLEEVDFSSKDELVAFAEGLAKKNSESGDTVKNRDEQIKQINRFFLAADKYFRMVNSLYDKLGEMKNPKVNLTLLKNEFIELRDQTLSAEMQIAGAIDKIASLIEDTALNIEQRKTYLNRLYECRQSLLDHRELVKDILAESAELMK